MSRSSTRKNASTHWFSSTQVSGPWTPVNITCYLASDPGLHIFCPMQTRRIRKTIPSRLCYTLPGKAFSPFQTCKSRTGQLTLRILFLLAPTFLCPPRQAVLLRSQARRFYHGRPRILSEAHPIIATLSSCTSNPSLRRQPHPARYGTCRPSMATRSTSDRSRGRMA